VGPHEPVEKKQEFANPHEKRGFGLGGVTQQIAKITAGRRREAPSTKGGKEKNPVSWKRGGVTGKGNKRVERGRVGGRGKKKKKSVGQKFGELGPCPGEGKVQPNGGGWYATTKGEPQGLTKAVKKKWWGPRKKGAKPEIERGGRRQQK